jgi:tetratricopeptide (TPR) repeat protein
MIQETEGQQVVTHGGGINGFNTLIVRFPESKDAIILLNNTGGADLQTMATGIKAILDGKPYDKPKMSAAMDFYSVVQKSGVEKGIEHFMKIKDDEMYEVSEREINSIGYDLLQNGKTKDAIAIFKMNIGQFPDSWNAYDSYGEALMEDGNKEAAIVNYKKSVAMNPGNTSGIKMLEKLGVKAEDVVKDVVIDDAVLATYVGKYELQPGFVITITKEGSQLSAQATGQGANEIYPKSEIEFYLKVVDASVVFNKEDNGEIKSMTLNQGGRAMEAKRIE